MSKFKVGDRVRIRPDLKAGERYRQAGEAVAKCMATEDMVMLAGRVVTLQECPWGTRYRIEGSLRSWTDEMFVGLASAKKIIVTTDGKTTTARLFNGKDLVKSATAKCSPKDEFVFETGAALALDRLLEREAKSEPEAPKFNKAELVNGRFGRMSNGNWFVVVGDHFVYESGGFDLVGAVDEGGSLSHYSVDCIVEASSFKHARSAFSIDFYSPRRIIWTRPGAKFG